MAQSTVIAKLVAEILSTFDSKGFDQAGASGSAFGKIVKRGMAVAAAALAAAAAAAVKMASDFEAGLTKIITLVGISRETVDAWGDALLELGPKIGRGPRELAEALFVVTSAGQRGAEALEIVEQAGKAAALGLGETKDVARAVTAALNAYGEETLSASRATDILTAIVREGNLEASSLAPTLGRVIGIAAQLGVSFEEVGANIATFTRLGVDSAEAVTALRGVLNSLLAPGEDAKKLFVEFGLSAEGLRKQLSEEGLQAVLATLVEKFGDNTEALKVIIPNVRAMGNVLGTAGVQGEQYAAVLESIKGSTGIVDTEFEKLANTLSFQSDQFKAAGEAALIAFGETMLPAIKATTKGLVELANFLRTTVAPAFSDLIDDVALVIESWQRLNQWNDTLIKDFRSLARSMAGLSEEVIDSEDAAGRLEDVYTRLASSVIPAFDESLIALGTTIDPGGRLFKGLMLLATFDPSNPLKNLADVLEVLTHKAEETGEATEELGEQLEKVVEPVKDVVKPIQNLVKPVKEVEEAMRFSLNTMERWAESILLVQVGIEKISSKPLEDLVTQGMNPLDAAIANLSTSFEDLDIDTEKLLVWPHDLGAALGIASDAVRDFTGTAQQLLATRGGPWGAALAGALELAKTFGIDINSILDDIVGGLIKGIGRAFGSGQKPDPYAATQQKQFDIAIKGADDLRKALSALDIQARETGLTLQESTTLYLEAYRQAIIRLQEDGLASGHPLIEQYRREIERLNTTFGDLDTEGLIIETQQLTQARERLRKAEEAQADWTLRYNELVNQGITSGEAWNAIWQESLAINDEAAAAQRAYNAALADAQQQYSEITAADIFADINERIRREAALAAALGEEYDETARRQELLREALERYILSGGRSEDVINALTEALGNLEDGASAFIDGVGLDAVVWDDVAKIFSEIDAQLEKMRFTAESLGEPFDALQAEADLVEQAIRKLIRDGYMPGHPVLDRLIQQWKDLNAAMESNVATFDTVVWDDVAKIFDEIDAQLEKMRLTAEALGEPFDALQAEADLVEQAIRQLIRDGYKPGHPVLDRLIQQYEDLNAAMGEHVDEIGFVQVTLDAFFEELAGAGRVFELTGNRAKYLADAVRLAEEAQRALQDAVGEGTLSVQEAEAAWLLLQEQIDRFRAEAERPFVPSGPGPGGGGPGGDGGGSTGITVDTGAGGSVVVRLPNEWEAGRTTLGVFYDIREIMRANVAATVLLASSNLDPSAQLRDFAARLSQLGFENPFAGILGGIPAGRGGDTFQLFLDGEPLAGAIVRRLRRSL